MSSYLLNLTGQFIGSHELMDQCCRIISELLKISRDDPAGQTTRILGEQLQVRSHLSVFYVLIKYLTLMELLAPVSGV